MTLKLNSSSSGSVSLVAPANTTAGADISLALPVDGGTLDRLERAGNILQVVTATTSTQVVTTSATYVDTTLTADITPASTNNKILVIVMQLFTMDRSSASVGGGLQVLRDSTVVYAPGANIGPLPLTRFSSIAGVTSINSTENVNLSFVDSPSSTSALTYKAQGRPYHSGTTTCTFNATGTLGPSTSTIILMEIAG